jgi:DNA-3-methyladenine glycosylase II
VTARRVEVVGMPAEWQRAAGILARRDPVLRRVIRDQAGKQVRFRDDAFFSLARSIVGQQISVKAAESVWTRLGAALGEVTPAAVARADVETLRGCGLSARKVEYLGGLAERFVAPGFDARRWHALPDAEVIADLVRLRGIGRWTAEMFLIFHLRRPDILPVDDLGLQKAVSLLYNGGLPLSRDELAGVGQRWAPWRSVATWYLWRSLDPVPVEY